MEESKLTNMQRQKINYNLRSGDSLPNTIPSTKPSFGIRNAPPILIRPGSSKRRTHNSIIESGAYEREKFRPDHSKIDRETLKKQLQEAMAYGKDGENKPHNKKQINKKVQSPKQFNRFDELIQEIEERRIWLKEMEELGEAHKHRDVINLQIEERFRELEKLKPASNKS